jgi:adenylate cyclase
MGEFARISISAKLIAIITVIVLLSLGATAFLNLFVACKYVEAVAIENNLDINSRISAQALEYLEDIQAGADIALALFYPPARNETFILNGDGDVLLHPDINLARIGANFSNRPYVRAINASPAWSGQGIFEDEGKKYLIAYNKIDADSLIGSFVVIITRMEYGKIFERVNVLLWCNIFFIAAVLSLSILFIRFYSKKITRPLGGLSDAVKKIKNGDFEIGIKPQSGDEIGALAEDIISMGKSLQTFGKFTNRDIAVKAMHGEINSGGLQKTATVLISDIQGFSEKAAGFTPDMTVEWLNEYLTQASDCVGKAGGLVDKFIGDSVMAHWGTIYSEGTAAKDAFNAIKAALLLRKALLMLDKEPAIRADCGITTGQVIAGKTGTENRMEYTVMGEPVVFAREIAGLNKTYGTDILISEETNKLVNYFYITEEMPPVALKGREKPVKIFAVVNHVSVTAGPKTLAEVRKLLGIKA